MAASHSGEDRHVEVVGRVLARAGVDESALGCRAHPPYDAETPERLLREGRESTALRHNCSGKHAGMLLFAHAAGWPLDEYWRRDHPVQVAALSAVATVTGLPADEIELATDGCGVPTFGAPLHALATAFARLAEPSAVPDRGIGAALEEIGAAMSAHPELVGGERRRLDTALMRAAPGRVVSKAGAEGIQGVAILARGGRTAASGLAVVIEDGDGARRAAAVATCEALRQLGVLDRDSAGSLAAFAAPVITDPRGVSSGHVRAAFTLATPAAAGRASV